MSGSLVWVTTQDFKNDYNGGYTNNPMQSNVLNSTKLGNLSPSALKEVALEFSVTITVLFYSVVFTLYDQKSIDNDISK